MAEKKTTAVARRHSVPMEALVIMDKDGKEARQVVIKKRLSVAEKTLTNTFSGMGVIVSAEGYLSLASACGLQPNHAGLTVIADGREQPNGYRDENGVLYYKCQIGGYTSLGNLVVSEATVSFDLDAYNKQDLLAKAAKHPKAFKLLPADEPKPGDGWAKYELDESVTLWLDTSYSEALAWMKDRQQQKKFADRKAQKMALRNAIKSHPAIVDLAIGDVGRQESIEVECRSWYTAVGPMRIDGKAFQIDLAKRLQAHDAEVVQANEGKVIDVTADEDELAVAQSETDAEEAMDAPPDMPPPDVDPDDDLPMGDDESRQNCLRILRDAEKKRPKIVEKARAAMGVGDEADIGDLGTGQLEDMLRLVRSAK